MATSILDRNFVYTTSAKTNIRARWAAAGYVAPKEKYNPNPIAIEQLVRDLAYTTLYDVSPALKDAALLALEPNHFNQFEYDI
jgi:hypothetical protein